MDELPTEKQCSKCLVFKPIEEFYRDKSSKDNKCRNCKECAKNYAKAHYRKNPQKKHEMTAKWRRENPEKAKELRDKWRRENPEKARECIRKWQAANPEKVREMKRNQKRKWQAANPEKAREKRQEKSRRKIDRKRATIAQQAIFRAQDSETLARIAKRLAKLEQK